jgi:hypothetical protein
MRQSLQKNQAFFLQGLLFLCKNAVFEPSFGILAEKRGISSARISTPPFCRGPPASAECFPLLEALLVVAHLLKDRHVVPGGEQLDLLGHMAKREALIISASIINTDVLQLLLIVGYFLMQKVLIGS